MNVEETYDRISDGLYRQLQASEINYATYQVRIKRLGKWLNDCEIQRIYIDPLNYCEFWPVVQEAQP